jgi:hypothetical protein
VPGNRDELFCFTVMNMNEEFSPIFKADATRKLFSSLLKETISVRPFVFALELRRSEFELIVSFTIASIHRGGDLCAAVRKENRDRSSLLPLGIPARFHPW